MEKIVVELDVKSSKGVKEVDKLNKEIKKTNKEVTNTSKSLDGATSSLDSFSGGAVTKFSKFKGAVGSLSTGFKSLKVAIIGTGIGALLISILAVKAAFTSSEEGQNKFAKIMGVIGSVTGNLIDILANLGEGIISVFENPKQAIIDLKNLIVENITNRITSLIDTFGFLGSAIKKVFSGDFSGAMDDAKAAGSSYIDTMTGVKNTIDKVSESVKNFATEITKEAKIAAGIADQRAKADKLERSLIVERAEANRKRAELLDKAANKEKFNAKERIEFLKEAGRIEEEITEKEIIAARLRVESKVAENKLSKSTKEDLTEEANLKAQLINLETARLTKAKLVTSQITAATREAAADRKAITTKETEDKKIITDKEIEDAKTLADLKKTIRDAEAVSEDERRALELIKIQEHFNNLILKAAENDLVTDELKAARDAVLLEKQKAFDKTDLERKTALANKETALAKRKIKEKAMVVDAISQFADAESGVGKALLIIKQGLALQETIMDLKRITFKGVEAVGAAGVSTAQNVAESSKIGFPWNLITIAGAIAQGVGIISSVKSAVGKTKAKAGGAGASVPSISMPSMPSTPPSFNVVGASSTDQLAGAIGSQSQQPVQAFVVSGDVSTSQELDRNIVTGASI